MTSCKSSLTSGFFFSSLLFFLSWMIFSVAYGQKPVFRHYSVVDGLPSSEVYCTLQDSNGYMWFGTDRGLVRFDGYNFKVYTSGKTGLLDNTIFGLYMDQRKRIWYQSYSGYTGYIFDGAFYEYRYNCLIKSIIKGDRIEGFNIDENGGLMFIKPYGGGDPLYIDSAGKEVKVNKPAYKDIYLTRSNACLLIGEADATTTRIISQETGKVLYTFPNKKTKDMRSFISRKKNGDLVVYSSSEVLIVNSDGIRKLFSCEEQVLSMLLDRNEDIWIGYMDKGLYRYQASENYVEARSILPGNSVSGMAQDREGGLWFTTLENGVFYLPPGMILSYGEASGFSKMKVTRIEQTGRELLCLLSDHRMASIMLWKDEVKMPAGHQDIKLNDLAHVPPDLTYYATYGEHGLSHKGIIIFDGQKIHIGHYDIWTHTTDNINWWDPGSKSLKHLTQVFARITCLFETGKNELLIGTVDGLYLYRNKEFSFLGTRHSFFTHRISNIVKLDDQRLVIASIGYGILVADMKDYSRSFQLTSSNGLPSDMCNTLLGLNKDTLLLGTNKGVCRITNITNPKSAKFHTIDISGGLISNEVNDMELVGSNLWVATGGGVSVVPLSHFDERKEMVFMNIEQVRVNNLLADVRIKGEYGYNQNNLQFFFTGINYQHSSNLLYKYRLEGSKEKWNISSERSVIYNGLPPGDYTFEVTVTGLNSLTSIPVKKYSFSISPPFWATWWFYCIAGLVVAGCIYWLVTRRIRVVRRQAQLQNDLNSLRDKALRAQMNPHFVFNSMNAIQNYIQKHDTQASIDYLSLFSKLMRTTFNNSGEKEVSLEEDLEAVSLYADMENMRFAGKFKLHISFGDRVKPSNLLVPPLLIQPFVENSIIHGFQTKQGQGNIWIHIETTGKGLGISIKDDGVGRKKTFDILKRSKTFLGTEQISSGITVTLERIRQAWGEDFSPDMYTVTDLYTTENHPSGTLIKFFLPIRPI